MVKSTCMSAPLEFRARIDACALQNREDERGIARGWDKAKNRTVAAAVAAAGRVVTNGKCTQPSRFNRPQHNVALFIPRSMRGCRRHRRLENVRRSDEEDRPKEKPGRR